MGRESAVLSGFSAPQPPGQLTAGWDTEDTQDPSFKSGDKKDVFVGTLEIGQHSSPHPGSCRSTNAFFKGCSPEFGHSNSE
ncbi:hypothetical protein CHARACLAT_032571 [Characodon lateralis]|uniref:Uncharacterized protein n=1 Tax=Characodon lateralis TaxID=208331 RepID=A0ABU7EET4_9TELE|nr:hypothetical protein [Characodon lateralis]